jgi:predicted SnoaL-like aldol condensation-catalyzing enzyme
MGHNLEVNKQNAIAFYSTAYLGDPSKAVEEHVGAEYIQHNPLVADGKQAFIDYFSEMASD